MTDKPRRKMGFTGIILIIGICVVGLRLLLGSPFSHSSLLYLAVPFFIAVVLYVAFPKTENESRVGYNMNRLRDATIIMLATSFILFEGFVCVLMFMPIYYFAFGIGLLYTQLADRPTRDKNKLNVHIIPLVVVILSTEGMFSQTTLSRQNQVTYVKVIDANIEELKLNMAQPITFSQRRHWFLSIFPLPTEINAGSLNEGDVHSLHFIYKRWFFTNITEGDMELLIAEVDETRVRTKVIKNTSYMAEYMSIDGTEVSFNALDNDTTEVTITLFYERKLDPAWYFGNLQRYAMTKSAEYLIETVIQRGYPDG